MGRRLGGEAGRVDEDGAGEVAQADLAGEGGKGGEVGGHLGGGLGGAGGGGGGHVHVDGDQSGGRMDGGAHAGGEGDVGFGEGGDLVGQVGLEGSVEDRGVGVGGDKCVEGGGTAGDETGVAGDWLGREGEARALASLGGADDANGDQAALGGGGGAVAVGQETVAARRESNEGTGHGGEAGGDTGAVNVADTVGGAGPEEGVVLEAVAVEKGDAGLAGAGLGQDADHGMG